MSVRDIITDETALRRKSGQITRLGEELDEVVADLFDTMYAAEGRGLAAPQIGVHARVFVMDATWKTGDKNPRICVNPSLPRHETHMEAGEEACLSLPGRRFRVVRPAIIDAAWSLPNGTPVATKLWGNEARIFCHELDHLDGILVSDRGVEL